jgi:hypothetical protein
MWIPGLPEFCSARALVIDSDGAPDEVVECSRLLRSADGRVWSSCSPHLALTGAERVVIWYHQLAVRYMPPGLAAIKHEHDGT